MGLFNKNKNKFYSLDKILKTDSTYNVIIGERSNGKTYSVLLYALKNYIDGKGQLAIVRRWKEDIRGSRASNIFNGLLANKEVEDLTNHEYQGIYYYAGAFYLCNYDKNGKPVYNESDLFCYCFALSDTEHNKSITYPHITTILFDEFLTRGVYLNDEFILFMNTISTIVRQRTNVKIFMLGNTVNKYSPYFSEMGLEHITKMEQGSIDVYTYGQSNLKVAVEYCSESKGKKESNFYFAFNNPKLEMIKSGAWELDIYPHLPYKYKPKDILFIFFIIFDDYIYQCEIVETENTMFIYIHDKTTPIQDSDSDLIYTLDYDPRINYNRSIYRPTTKVGNVIKNFFINDKVFYQDNNVGDSISNYLKICRGI